MVQPTTSSSILVSECHVPRPGQEQVVDQPVRALHALHPWNASSEALVQPHSLPLTLLLQRSQKVSRQRLKVKVLARSAWRPGKPSMVSESGSKMFSKSQPHEAMLQ